MPSSTPESASGSRRGALRRLLRQRGAVLGLAILAALALMALAAPWLSPRDPIKTSPREALQAPGPRFLLGSDQYGRDVASRALHGARLVADGRSHLGLDRGRARDARRADVGLLRRAGRRVRDARRGRPARVPGHPARSGDRERAEPRSEQRHDRGGPVGGAELRPARPGQRALGPGAALRGSRAGARQPRSVDRLPLHPAECRRAAHRHGHARSGHRDPLGRGAQLSRARQPAAAAGVGADAERGARLPARGLVDLDGTRPRHHADGARDEPARRRASRRARSRA